MTNLSLSPFTVGMAVSVSVSQGSLKPGRVLATDLKGDRPLAVAWSHRDDDNEIVTNFKEDGTTTLDYFFVKRAPLIRETYRTFGKYDERYQDRDDYVGAHLFSSLEVLRKAFPLSKTQLKFTYEDNVLKSVEVLRS
jgi:hypothetical protein